MAWLTNKVPKMMCDKFIQNMCDRYAQNMCDYPYSSSYKAYIDARVGVKQNSYREYNKDAHYLFARNKMRRELASLHSEEIIVISVDDMAKIKVGAPAVSRYHQIGRLFLENDIPNLCDHDFPVPGYLLSVSGHMILTSQNQNVDQVEEEPIIINSSNKETQPFNVISKMKVGKIKGNIYSILSEQSSIQWNTNMSPTECLDAIIEALNSQPYEGQTHGISKNIDHSISLESLDTILDTAANLFKCKIVVYFKEEHKYEKKVYSPSSDVLESPLYILREYGDSNELTFRSVTFNYENRDEFPELSEYEGQIRHGNIGRVHLHTPHSGPLHLRLRSSKFNPSTIATHVNDLFEILKEQDKPACIIISDGGPDYSPVNVINSLYYFRLFKELNMDLFAVSTYAAKYSAYNPVEHAWSPLSNKLSGVIFDSVLDGDTKPPFEQRNLSASEREEKEYAVFDKALSDLAAYWSDATFDGFPISIKTVFCGDKTLKWNDFLYVKEYFKAPIRELHKYSDLSNECKTMFRHLDRHANEIVFVRCDDKSCCNEWRSRKLYDHLSIFNFQLPAPVFGSFYDGHFDTFLQRLREKGKGQKYGDDGQPSVVSSALEKCKMCPNYKFKSKTEQARHISMFHRRQQSSYKNAEFKCLVCEKLFTSLSSLNRHKVKEGHNARKSGASIEKDPLPKKRRRTTKQRNINDMLRQYQKRASTSKESDSDEDSCSSPDCCINSLDNRPVIVWVGCESCNQWYHSVCVGLGEKSKMEIERIDYICRECSCS